MDFSTYTDLLPLWRHISETHIINKYLNNTTRSSTLCWFFICLTMYYQVLIQVTILNETNGNNEFTAVQKSFLCFSLWVKIRAFYRWYPPRITYPTFWRQFLLHLYLWLELSKMFMKQWPVWAVDIGAGLEQEADEERLTGLAGKVEDVPTLVIHLTSDLLLLIFIPITLEDVVYYWRC